MQYLKMTTTYRKVNGQILKVDDVIDAEKELVKLVEFRNKLNVQIQALQTAIAAP